MTYDQIEYAVERKFDRLDRRLMSNELTQTQYDELAKSIAAWADAEYECAIQATALRGY